jgi:hypothetical protein
LYEKSRKCRPKKIQEENIKINLPKTSFEDAKWIKLTQDHVQWKVLVLEVLHIQILLPYS